MEDFNIYNVADGVDVVSVFADRFKTNEICITFSNPLTEKTASCNALLAGILSSTTKAYPDMLSFNKRLAMLYGASVDYTVSKSGENQLVTITVSSLDDKFSLEDKKISYESFELLMSLIFNPNTDKDGNFYADDIEREKRLLIEKIESEENEKRIYSLRRLEKIMFSSEPYSINRYGSKENVAAVGNEDLKSALERFKRSAKVMITVVSSAAAENIVSLAKEYFKTIERNYMPPVKAVFVPRAEKINTVTERIDVKQGKLLLGFRVEQQSDFSPNPQMRSFCDVFGGGPYSKLFLNVREKLSLCYYCSARYDRRKACIIIQCGCEEENMDKAVDEILNQLDLIKQGDFDEAFVASKVGLSDVINGVGDDISSLSAWYSSQITDTHVISPSESAAANGSVTKQQIIDCANLISLDTVYRLVGRKEAE